MAAHQRSKRLLAALLLLTLCATWVPAHAQTLGGGTPTTVGTFPPPAPAVALWHPQDTVPQTTSRNDADYTIAISGHGIPLQEFPFDSSTTRPLCFSWTRFGTSPWVETAAWSVATGTVLTRGRPVIGNVESEIAFQIRGGRMIQPWRTAKLFTSPGDRACLVTMGRTGDFEWLSKSLWNSGDPYLEAMLQSAVAYYQENLLMFPRWAGKVGVWFERRPSMLLVSQRAGKTKLDVLQEPLAFTGTPPEYGEEILASEQMLRWRAFRLVTALQAGISEGYALAMITKKPAMSAPLALLEATAAGVPIKVLTRPLDFEDALMRVDDAPTAVLIQAALAAGSRVIVTQHPVITSSGWRGTPWVAFSPTSSGTYLNTLRGAEGQAGTQPNAAYAEGLSHAKDTAAYGLSLAAFGFSTLGAAEGPTGTVAGLAAVAIGLAIAARGYALAFSLHAQYGAPKQGHVDIDEGPAGIGVAAGPGGGDGVGGGGPAGSAPGGPAGSDPSEGCCGANGNGNSPSGGVSGAGGDGGASEGDPGDDT